MNEQKPEAPLDCIWGPERVTIRRGEVWAAIGQFGPVWWRADGDGGPLDEEPGWFVASVYDERPVWRAALAAERARAERAEAERDAAVEACAAKLDDMAARCVNSDMAAGYRHGAKAIRARGGAPPKPACAECDDTGICDDDFKSYPCRCAKGRSNARGGA